MKRVAVVVAWVIGVYLVGRAIAEPFMIDVGDPATYERDWGGPSLVGVLVVHMGPGVVSAILMTRALRRRREQRAQEGRRR